MCIQIRQILAGRIGGLRWLARWKTGENGTRSRTAGAFPASCLSTMTPCPFSPPPPLAHAHAWPRPPLCSAPLCSALRCRPRYRFSFSVFAQRTKCYSVFGAALRCSFNATRLLWCTEREGHGGVCVCMYVYIYICICRFYRVSCRVLCLLARGGGGEWPA